MLYIRLFHGRTDPEQNMDSWGTDGPIFGPYSSIKVTYNSFARLSRQDGICHEIFGYEDMLFYDGIYYGD